MKQYLDLLKEIKEKGTYKPPAREGMPGTQSLFGYQFRHDLQDGFPLLTTKKLYWKGIVTELLWFLRGDTNIKYLVDNGANFWNEDAYNYFLKVMKKQMPEVTPISFEEFIDTIKEGGKTTKLQGYTYGDCGYQYGKVWRDWDNLRLEKDAWASTFSPEYETINRPIDQIANVIKSLKETPESRRHIVTAVDPAHDKDLALYWCHSMFQFHCRPLSDNDKLHYIICQGYAQKVELEMQGETIEKSDWSSTKYIINKNHWDAVPKYYLDCQLYQRSADVVLGVPFNIASYALLTHILAKICNMIPGEYIHTFGDVHIYDNHKDAVEEQLFREPRELPKLELQRSDYTWQMIGESGNFKPLMIEDFKIIDYNPHPAIKAELSTGLKK
jgi:thymidylate synthase